MINLTFKKLEHERLIDWGVILLGWKGIPECDRIFSPDNIVHFVITEVEKKEEYISSALIELYSAAFLSKEEVTLYLQEICNEEEMDLEISFKKLLLIALEMNIEFWCKNSDYIDGLNEISNFWILWGNPEGNPHTFLKPYRNMSPDDYYSYYSKENYEQILDANKFWLEQEK